MNTAKVYLGAIIIGSLLSLMGYPIYDFKTEDFSGKNLTILFLVFILVLVFSLEKKSK